MPKKIWVKAFIETDDGENVEIGSTGVYNNLPDEASAGVIANADEFLTKFKPEDQPAGGEEVATPPNPDEATPPK